MIYEKRNKFCFRNEEGKLFKFDTLEEAEMALNLLNMGTEVEEETQNANEETQNETQDSNEAPSHYGWLEEKGESEAEES